MTDRIPQSSLSLADSVARRYGELPQVEAVAIAGSQTSGAADERSDIDLYVYMRAVIPLSDRARIAGERSERSEVGNAFWEPGDEWVDADTGIHVDVMFRRVEWVEGQLDRVLRGHEASVGYSTCIWHSVLTSQTLYDRIGWFQALQARANQPYPDQLVRAIIAKNHPILRDSMSSYLHQIESAVRRGDLVSANHRVAALLASYFDILFAVNHLPHPGEKRLVEIAEQRCEKLPQAFRQHTNGLVQAAGRADSHVIERANALIDDLDKLLQAEGLLSADLSP